MSEIGYLLPVFDFYGLSRHCIVHNMGTASEELKKIWESKEFVEAIDKWPTVIQGRKLSSAPQIDVNRKINLNPHHAITYSDICYRISKVINLNIFKTLGVDYFVLRIAKFTILDRTQLLKPFCRDVYAYINYQLTLNYNIKSLSPTSLRSILEAGGDRKKIVAKYGTMKNKRHK